MKPSFVTALSLWVLPGLMAGAGFLGIALIVGALTRTVWAVPDSIAQAIGITAPPEYGFALWPVVVGVAVHLAFSIGLGAIFTVLARRLRLHGWVLVAAAILFIGLETPITIWVILYRILPTTTFKFFLYALPFWGSFLGRCIYGLILGLLLALHPLTASQKSQQHIASQAAREKRDAGRIRPLGMIGPKDLHEKEQVARSMVVGLVKTEIDQN